MRPNKSEMVKKQTKKEPKRPPLEDNSFAPKVEIFRIPKRKRERQLIAKTVD